MPRFFQPHPIALDDLQELGVVVYEAAEPESAHVDPESGHTFVVVGAVMLSRNDGQAHVYPRVGSERRPLAMPAMLTKAEDALLGSLAGFARGKRWWWTSVMLPIDSPDVLWKALNAAATEPFDPRDRESERLWRIRETR